MIDNIAGLIEDQLSDVMRDLEDEATQAHKAAVASHRRLKAALEDVNSARLEYFADVLHSANMGYCRECSRFRWLDDLRLALPNPEWHRQQVTVRAVCTACWNRYGEMGWLRPVQKVGMALYYQVDIDIWSPVPSGERMTARLFAPVKRISLQTAERFSVHPTLHIDYHSAPPAVAPCLGVYCGQRLVTS